MRVEKCDATFLLTFPPISTIRPHSFVLSLLLHLTYLLDLYTFCLSAAVFA